MNMTLKHRQQQKNRLKYIYVKKCASTEWKGNYKKGDSPQAVDLGSGHVGPDLLGTRGSRWNLVYTHIFLLPK